MKIGEKNATTPMGLKALKEMQEANPSQDKASEAEMVGLPCNN